MRHITILLYPRALASSIALPAEMFQAAMEIEKMQAKCRRQTIIEIAATDPNPVRLLGCNLQPDTVWESVENTDLVILPGLWRNPLKVVHRYPALLHWIKRQWQAGSQLCAVGSASFFLAEAGLLNGKPATTHWHHFERFARRYPDVLLQRNHLITKAGRIYCAGSVNSVADLVVQFINEMFGRNTGEAVESHFSPEVRKSYKTQMFNQEGFSPHDDEDILQAQYWLRTHFNETIYMHALAERLGLTIRSLNRRFKNACGQSPGQYLQQIRVENAKELLRSSNCSISEIADKVGYQDSGHFSSVFKQWVGRTPKQYRSQVRGKLFVDEFGDH
jgi:transcriptional regulator GlxA family with amidase domain